MLKNYFRIARRYLLRHPAYATLNVFGLALGIASMGALLLYVHHEFSYDRHHENADQIRRIVVQQTGSFFMGSDHFAVTPAPLAEHVRTAVPSAETATLISTWTNQWITDEAGERFYGQLLWTDPHAFEIFSFDFIEGTPTAALTEPNHVILSQTTAQKIFGNASALGRTLIYGDYDPFEVVGVIADAPETSSLQYAFILPVQRESYFQRHMESWSNSSYQTFALLSEATTASDFDRQLRESIQPFLEADDNEHFHYYTEALTDIHLFTQDAFRDANVVSFGTLMMLLGVAVLILIIACTNYVNMATAQLALRTREVGVRKVVGAQKGQVMLQFLAEAALLVLVAIGMGIGLLELALPRLSDTLGSTLTLAPAWSIYGLVILTSIWLFTTLCAGGYPAFLLARLQPVQILKNKGLRSQRRPMRSILVSFQFVAVIALGAVSLLIFQQLRYAQNKALGFDRSYVFTVGLRDADLTEEQRTTLIAEIKQHSAVSEVALGNFSPFRVGSQNTLRQWEGRLDDAEDVRAYQMSVSANYIDLYGIEVVHGRPFNETRDQPAEGQSTPALVNEKLIQTLGWTPEEAVGRNFGYYNEEYPGQTIVGVIRDFHAHSLHLPIAPLFMRHSSADWLSLHIRTLPGRYQDALVHTESVFQGLAPQTPFEHTFADDAYAELYASEQQMSTLITVFTLLTILIACLGIGGLSAFVAQQRTAEIGLRKVLGATTAQILALFSKDLLRLTLLAFVIGSPIAYFIADGWLNVFAYRIDVGIWPFILSGLAAGAAALLAAAYPALRASQVNPAETLRTEG